MDDAIGVAFKYGYLHHILRLMVVANFMNLCRIHPAEMYRWFMEFSLDSYDWVMVPNVFGMASYSSTLMSTKPYVCSSAYIARMSNYGPRSADWAVLWDGLYYSFLAHHRDTLGRSPRMSFMYRNAERRGCAAEIQTRVDEFLQSFRSINKRMLSDD